MSTASFRRVTSEKKFYTISNLIKAGVLAAITPIAIAALPRMVMENDWDTTLLRNMGCVYAIPDFVAMLVVRRMSLSTYVHHSCVVVFNLYSIHNDYNEDNVCRLVVVYAAFSTFGYVVYMLLASRFLGVSPSWSRVLSLVSAMVYLVCCGLNWTWQATYLRHLLANHPHWTVYVYMCLICFVMWDDLNLNRWLLHNARTLSAVRASPQPRPFGPWGSKAKQHR